VVTTSRVARAVRVADAATAWATRTSRPTTGTTPSWRSGQRCSRCWALVVCPGLVDQRQSLVELAGLEAAGAGQQGSGCGQVVLDQLGLPHGLPGDDGSSGQDQGEHQHHE